MRFDRRTLIAGGLAASTAACIPPGPGMSGRLASQLRIVEASANGNLGAAIYDTGTGLFVSHNGFARFPHASSFKLSLAALVLKRIQAGTLDGSRVVAWLESALLGNSPFTTERVGQGATLRELAEAAQKQSDNTAANVLLEQVGGPEALTAFWRSLGDGKSQLDRYEPELNHVPSGEITDTTTPDAMTKTVAELVYGDALDPADRNTIRQWMIDTSTGLTRVRAGLPDGWIAGDKTGTSLWPGMRSVYVDIGFAEPPGHAPLTYAAYFRANEQHLKIEPSALAVLADVGRVIARLVATGSA